MLDQEISDRAASLFSEGYNCAEAVSMAFQEAWKVKESFFPRLASGFGGGIGRQGSVCGALAGGILAINLKHGRRNSADKKHSVYELSAEFYRQFESRHGSSQCRKLTGCDLTTPEGQKKFKDENIHGTVCNHLVSNSCRILCQLLEK